jgi:hypothetical protein
MDGDKARAKHRRLVDKLVKANARRGKLTDALVRNEKVRTKLIRSITRSQKRLDKIVAAKSYTTGPTGSVAPELVELVDTKPIDLI